MPWSAHAGHGGLGGRRDTDRVDGRSPRSGCRTPGAGRQRAAPSSAGALAGPARVFMGHTSPSGTGRLAPPRLGPSALLPPGGVTPGDSRDAGNGRERDRLIHDPTGAGDFNACIVVSHRRSITAPESAAKKLPERNPGRRNTHDAEIFFISRAGRHAHNDPQRDAVPRIPRSADITPSAATTPGRHRTPAAADQTGRQTEDARTGATVAETRTRRATTVPRTHRTTERPVRSTDPDATNQSAHRESHETGS